MNVLPYLFLVRLHRPIGILLLLWPTLWALWIAQGGQPAPSILAIFVAGVVIMRSLGCIINDMLDRNIDPHVRRTCNRPLASKQVSLTQATVLAVFLAVFALTLVWQLNWLTIQLAFVGALVTCVYPLLKRITYLPQLGLGIAFSWGVPMAFAAIRNQVGFDGWCLFFMAMLWPIIYDTQYAMSDREDDIKLGVKSTAILFGKGANWILGGLQVVFIFAWYWLAPHYHLQTSFYWALFFVCILFIYQHWLILQDKPAYFYRAFQNNNWVGLVIFIGILLSYKHVVF